MLSVAGGQEGEPQDKTSGKAGPTATSGSTTMLTDTSTDQSDAGTSGEILEAPGNLAGSELETGAHRRRVVGQLGLSG